MIIRYLTQNDITEHDKVSSQAFSIECDIYDKNSVLPAEKVLGAFDDDNKTLFADLEIIDRKCNFDGGLLTCAAVGGVAAKPEHRGKGAVKELFRYISESEKYDISILYPFSDEYYRKLGYERVSNSVSASIPFSELSKIKRNNDVTMYEGKDSKKLLEIYNRCASLYNLSFVRENASAFSNKPYFSKKYTYIWKNNSFASITVDRENSVLNVEEIYYDSCESMLGILGFLRNFEGNQETVCFGKIPENSPILNCVSDFKKCDIRVHSTGAAKILNVENVLKSKKYPASNGGFTFGIGEDIFSVAYSADGTAINKTQNGEPDVIMDTAAASRILLGGIRRDEFIPGFYVNDPESDFFRIFTPKTTFFTDGF